MTFRTALATAGMLSLFAAACDQRASTNETAADESTPANAATPAQPKASIMRPSVVNETNAGEAAKPAPKPFRATIYFDPGTSSLDDTAKAALARVLQAAGADSSATLTIRGHSDTTGEPSANLLMSAERANVVRDYLVEHGVAEARIVAAALGERGSAPASAVQSEVPDADGDRQRRVEIIVEPPSVPASAAADTTAR
jgi:OOP family OmpA-OmpF porin